MYPEPQQGRDSPAGKSRIRRALDLISTVISFSHTIRVFGVKWQSIRNKLEELLSTLSAVENCEDSGEDSELFDSVNAITATLKICLDLANICADLSYGGKLRTQSDLDIASAKLDGHIKNLAEIYARGLLSQGYAIIVSRPGISASRDDIKFYVNDLLSRMKIGNKDMKNQALVCFNEVIQEDERYVKVAIEIENFVGVLVNFLDFHENDIREEASKAVSVIAGIQAYRNVLIRGGIIGPLIRALESGSDLSKEYATRCLQKVTENSDNAWSVSAQGGVTVLLKICSKNDFTRGELVGLACGVLKNLVGVEEIKRFLIEEGAIPVFIKLVGFKDEVTQICAIDFLQCMGSGDESTRQMIIKEGGVRVLVSVLDPKSSFSSKTREVALRGIMNLCFSLANFANYGFMDHVMYFIRYGEGSIQELALKAVFWLCGISEEAKKAMGDLGVMPELVKFLDNSKSYEVREMAAETLSSMVIVPGNRKRFVQNDQNVVLLMQMLDPQEASFGNKKLLLSILLSLTSCNTARKKIVNSGYFKNIEKLAEADVSDAKKIVRKLSTSRFKNILSGIWHS